MRVVHPRPKSKERQVGAMHGILKGEVKIRDPLGIVELDREIDRDSRRPI